MEKTTLPLISVGLIVRNESHQIQACLQCLRQNHLNPHPIEIILVDNQSTDDTIAQARNFFSDQPELLQIYARTSNHMAEARNDALRIASGEQLAFTDADCRVEADWIKKLKSHLDAAPQNCAGVGGPNSPPPGHRFSGGWALLTKERLLHTGSIQASAEGPLQSVPHLTTTHVLFQKKSLAKVGGFHPHHSSCGEDLEMSYRLLSQGFQLLQANDSIMEHRLPSSWGAWLKKCWAYGSIQWSVVSRFSWKINPRRFFSLTAILMTAILILAWPPLWIFLTILQVAWFGSQILFRPPLRISLRVSVRAVAWVVVTQQVYALASVAGALRILFLRRNAPAPRLSPKQ